ncbi:MAG: ABC transporter substrate-binding protein [Opitutaceae bacterium]|jgi:raffinose/stachyose/melibiose transport system substrate-binding protein|nr:ABC transporter substrate-binding protein [Opitutaceae bacterium]
MTREKISNIIGLLLLAGCFTWSLVKVAGRERAERSGRPVIRLAHWQLEGGIRDAIDGLARDYEKLHPGIQVEQLAIPERVYAQWLQTRLIGGTATDIIQIGMIQGGEDNILARFFLPLSDLVEQPNPYNKGTPLERTAWRETFIDGLEAGYSYRPNLIEYYGVGLSMFTIRIYANASLWRRVLGDTPPPAGFREFLDICHRVKTWAEEKKTALIPVAGSRANGPQLIGQFTSSQTQRLTRQALRTCSLKASPAEVGMGYLLGDWTLDSPGLTSAFAINREVGLLLQPGYMSVSREDASFYFLQKHALMIATGSWDASSFRQQADFELMVFDIPIPSRTHPEYGPHVLGPSSEAAITIGFTLGVNQRSPLRDQAIDFLHYLTSQQANGRFSERSGWLPSVAGVTPSPFVRAFLPRTEGYVNGFGPGGIGANTKRILDTANNLLVQPSGSVEEFKARIRPSLENAIRQDLARQAGVTGVNVGRQDLSIAAWNALRRHESEKAGQDPVATADDDSSQRLSKFLEAQNEQESTKAWIASQLAARRSVETGTH